MFIEDSLFFLRNDKEMGQLLVSQWDLKSLHMCCFQRKKSYCVGIDKDISEDGKQEIV